MATEHRLIATEADAGLRLDRFIALSGILPVPPKSSWSRAVFAQ